MIRSRALAAAVLPLTLIAAALTTGCTAAGPTVECAPEGDVSKALVIEGDFGGELTLTSETPVSVESLQRSVLIEGEGAEIGEGDSVQAQFTIIDGETGEVKSNAPADMLNDGESLTDWAQQALTCSRIGDRTAIVVPTPDVIGAGNAESYGLKEESSLILVFDFTDLQKGCETLAPREEKYPEVELGDGTTKPEITIPKCMEEPTELEVTTLSEGDGPVVQEGDTVSFDYVGMFWRTGEIFDSSWDRGQALELPTTQVIEGFSKAMVGQKVGSTVLSVVPDELGYNDGNGVRVFVIDIREIVPAE